MAWHQAAVSVSLLICFNPSHISYKSWLWIISPQIWSVINWNWLESYPYRYNWALQLKFRCPFLNFMLLFFFKSFSNLLVFIQKWNYSHTFFVTSFSYQSLFLETLNILVQACKPNFPLLNHHVHQWILSFETCYPT